MPFILRRGDSAKSPEAQHPGGPRHGGDHDAAPTPLRWQDGRAILTGPAGDRVDLPIELLLGARVEEAARPDGSGVDLRLVVDMGDGHGGTHSGGGRARVQLIFPLDSAAQLTSAVQQLLTARRLNQQIPPRATPSSGNLAGADTGRRPPHPTPAGLRLTGPHPDIRPAVSASATLPPARSRHAAPPDSADPERFAPPAVAPDNAEWLSFRLLPGSAEIIAQYPHE